MIYKNSKISEKSKNLKGFINNKTIEKYIIKNKKITENKLNYKINPNNILIFITLFCGSLFSYHLYTLWLKYSEDKKSNEIL